MTEQTPRGTDPEARNPEDGARPAGSGRVTVRARPVHRGVDGIPLQAARFLRALDRSRA